MSDKHPAPWQWAMTTDSGGIRKPWRLEDANGREVISGEFDFDDPNVRLASPLAGELIRLAPEMEAALRRLEWISDREETACYECGVVFHAFEPAPAHETGCSIGTILAALDAARAVTVPRKAT
jgi:hypothetical protein